MILQWFEGVVYIVVVGGGDGEISTVVVDVVGDSCDNVVVDADAGDVVR